MERLAALALLALGLVGCGDSASAKEGDAVTCEKEAPRLCAFHGKHHFLPKNLKSICGGAHEKTKLEEGGMVLQLCSEHCGNLDDPTEASMTICVAETLTKAEVVIWGTLDSQKDHQACKQVIDRICKPEEGREERAPEFADVCNEDVEKEDLTEKCVARCTNNAGLAECLLKEVFVEYLQAKQKPVPETVASDEELHFVEQVEASVLSEGWGVMYPKLPTHNSDILIHGLKARHHEDDKLFRQAVAALPEHLRVDTDAFIEEHNRAELQRLERERLEEEGQVKFGQQYLSHVGDHGDSTVLKAQVEPMSFPPVKPGDKLNPALERKMLYQETAGKEKGLVESAASGGVDGAAVDAGLESAVVDDGSGPEGSSTQDALLELNADIKQHTRLEHARASLVGRTEPLTSHASVAADRARGSWVVGPQGAPAESEVMS